MSTAAKITFGAAVGVSAGIIGFIYWKQQDDR